MIFCVPQEALFQESPVARPRAEWAGLSTTMESFKKILFIYYVYIYLYYKNSIYMFKNSLYIFPAIFILKMSPFSLKNQKPTEELTILIYTMTF